MELSLFDLHCDTAYETYRTGMRLSDNTLAVSLKKASCFSHYIQVMAHWTPPTLSDRDGWAHFLNVRGHLLRDPAILSGRVTLSFGCPTAPPDHPTLLLSLEDARILEGDLSRVSALYAMGIRIVTPLWRGVSSLGGAHDTKEGLSDFGRLALSKMLEKGMVLDVSHASPRSFDEMLALSDAYALPCIASHSNAYALCPVSRNLQDGQIKRLLSRGGIIGINLCKAFLNADRDADVEDVLRHVSHFLQMGAEHSLCLGCDFDGAETPVSLSDLSMLPRIAEALYKRNFSEALIRALFFENAFSFAKKHIKTENQT